MAILNFPSSPSINDTYSENGRTWIWNGTKWAGVGAAGPQGYSGFSGFSSASGFSGFSAVSGFSGKSGFSGYCGSSGFSGYSGLDGTSVSLKGSVANFASLPGGAAAGDLWITLDTGDGWVSDGVGGWSNIGPIRGPTGVSGFSGYSGFSGISGLGLSGFSGYCGATGTSGFSGFSGTAAIGGAFVHTQGSPASTWSIAHNLGSRYVNIEPIDSTGVSYVGRYDYPTITFTDANNATLVFGSAVTGWAAVTSGGGTSGWSGFSGYSSTVTGPSGFSGFSGISGFSGVGTSGFSGYCGATGTSGFSGFSSTSGFSGFSSISGFSGFSGTVSGLQVEIPFIIDGGGSVIATGVKGYIRIPFNCTIDQVTLLADVSGSIVVDIWKDTYANYPPTVADTITASAKPTLSSAIKSQDSTLTGWTTSITSGDVLGYNVDSATTVTRVTVSLRAIR